ncbi:MAG: N-acetylglucosamine kinase [Flavobacteriaceae bacterium]|nr:N-acetylglucosamine kinase [Flavobacteriaceae bacterium]MDG2313864.1 N-acetylglucosamine kinase [Flavobacteriaceae bacterium]
MKLIVDSGSTKTDWIALDDSANILFESQTLGLNPQVLTEYIIEERIINNFQLYQSRKEVTHLYFYGAGCGTRPPVELISRVFKSIFINAKLIVKEDTYAAAYAVVTPSEPSVVCILGTGSNCSLFDGEKLHQRVTSLGYVLMDDASGNYFGRQLLRDFYFNRIPSDLAQKFEKEYDLGDEVIKDHLYKKPNPNTYLATFARFLIENKDNKYAQKLIRKGLKLFVKNQILQFDEAATSPVHFVGSISFYLEKELRQVMKSFDLEVGRIVKKPIDGLVKYHQSL